MTVTFVDDGGVVGVAIDSATPPSSGVLQPHETRDVIHYSATRMGTDACSVLARFKVDLDLVGPGAVRPAVTAGGLPVRRMSEVELARRRPASRPSVTVARHSPSAASVGKFDSNVNHPHFLERARLRIAPLAASHAHVPLERETRPCP
jgi:hypothetical protein